MTLGPWDLPAFPRLLGVTIIEVSPDRVRTELLVRHELTTTHRVMHGGVVMTLADNAAGIATIANLPPGSRVTTVECKTNFFAAIPEGDVARTECTPLHRGRTTMVWETRITRGDGRLAALVTQTQLVLPPDAVEV